MKEETKPSHTDKIEKSDSPPDSFIGKLICFFIPWLWFLKVFFLFYFISVIVKEDSFLRSLIADNFEVDRFRSVYDMKPDFLSRRINEPQKNLLNPYADGFYFDFYVYVTENARNFESERGLIWVEKNLTYGSHNSFRQLRTILNASNNVQNNCSLYLHLYLVKSGVLPSSFGTSQMNENYCCFTCSSEGKIIHRVRRLNVFKRTRDDRFDDGLHSHWHPNLTIHLVHNQDNANDLQQFDEIHLVDTYPIFFNDQFNYLRDYQPINRMTKALSLHLTFDTVDLQMYTNFTEYTDRRLKNFFGKMKVFLFGFFNKRLLQTEGDQDLVRKLVIDLNFETAKYRFLPFSTTLFLLGCFMEILIIELICKKSWKNLKAVSARSSYFQLVQSLVCLDVLTFILHTRLLWLWLKMKSGNSKYEYHSKTNGHDAVATRFFTIFIFLPMLIGHFVYSYHPNESFCWQIPELLFDFFWYYGSIIWIPQIYIHYKLQLCYEWAWFSIISKIIYLIGQLACVAYYFDAGFIWLVFRYYPSAILGISIQTLVYLVLVCQLVKYDRTTDLPSFDTLHKDQKIQKQSDQTF